MTDSTRTAPTTAAAAAPRRGFGRALRAYFEPYRLPAVRSMLFLGFSSGLPFSLVGQTLNAWLREDGVMRSKIGMLAWVGLIFSLKFLWAPVVDRVPLPLLTRALGRRRGWMLLGQCGIVAGLLNLAAAQPGAHLTPVALGALFLAFCAGTQDIAMDAWRIESAPEALQGAMAGAYQAGYRGAVLVSTAGALALAQVAGWHASYTAMAVLGGVGVLTTLLVSEPHPHTARVSYEQEGRVRAWLLRNAHLPRPLQAAGGAFVGAVLCPLTDFFSRFRLTTAVLLLLLIGSYRLTDFTMGPMASPFYIDHGYTLEQIAAVVKVVGVSVSVLGVLLAGMVIARLGLIRSLVLGSLAIMASNCGFAWLATTSGPTLTGLAAVNIVDFLALALHGTALIAFLSALTSARYTATQYALFSSFYALPSELLKGTSGFVADAVGYHNFFLYTASLSIPSLVLIYVLTRPPLRGALPG
ncbi:MAG TPA: MFS transporter [Steroidobacteraceae bacterium]|nr:MFS transporter [Steroidobacteraceae bacterium]